MASHAKKASPTIDELALAEQYTPQAPLITRLAAEARRIRDEQLAIVSMQEVIDARAAALLKSRQTTLVDMMDAAGIDKFGLPGEGNLPPFNVSVHPFYNAKIDPENLEKACEWLEENESGDIVKHTFTVSLGKGQEKEANKLRKLLSKEGFSEMLEEKLQVHAGTLKATVKDFVERQSICPPTTLFNTEIGRIADVKPRRSTK